MSAARNGTHPAPPAFNGVLTAGGSGNRVLSNAIYGNAELDIEAYPSVGLTPNDTGDIDGLQNFPTLLLAKASGSTTTVAGLLHSRSNESCLVRFSACRSVS